MRDSSQFSQTAMAKIAQWVQRCERHATFASVDFSAVHLGNCWACNQRSET